MDFDFTKLLLVLVLITGVLWALDVFVWRKNRKDEDPDPVYVEWGASFFPILVIVFFLRSFVFEPFQIPSSSMEPTLEIGDFLVVSKFSYGVRMPVTGHTIIPIDLPKRGDVVVFVPPHDSRYFIKRVIGLPGDKVRVQNNQVYVNDEPLEQTFISNAGMYPENGAFRHTIRLSDETVGDVVHNIHTLQPASRFSNVDEVIVQEGHYFMMGDNRDRSGDSRDWGQVPESNLVGKAKYVWMHWPNWGSLPSFSDNRAIN